MEPSQETLPVHTTTDRRRIAVHPVVFAFSSCILLILSGFGVASPQLAAKVFSATQTWVIESFGWFYMLAVATFLAFSVYLACSRFGDIRLGPDDCEPDYTRLSWFAMLFSAGVGIGLMFFGVAEPTLHFGAPPTEGIAPRSPAAAREAMNATFLHWGVHGWSVYVIVGLALAYFSFRHDLPLTLRSALYPLIGERIYGPIGNMIDIIAVLGTVIGVATSLGFGALQINAGLNYLFGLSETAIVQVALIAFITAMATISVAAGLDAGIKRLSELNMLLAVLLLLFVFLLGPTAFLMSAYVQNVGAYLADLVNLTFRQFAYQDQEWLGAWTLFYWAWWIAWAPFVGMFIARISRGRTIREFIIGVLAVPTLFVFFWMTVFGDTAIHAILNNRMLDIAQLVSDNMPLALFVFLEEFPFSFVTSLLAVLLIVTFFVTSADSGSLVVDMLTSAGVESSPVWQRIFWAVLQGVIAAALLLAGGLGALQAAALSSGLPLAVVLLFICAGLYIALHQEHEARERHTGPPLPVARVRRDWRQRLASLVRHHDRRTPLKFIIETARPALESVAEELRGHNVNAVLDGDEEEQVLRICEGENMVFEYGVTLRSYRMLQFTFAVRSAVEARRRHWFAEAWCSSTGEHYDVLGLTREALIDDLLVHYSCWVNARTEPWDGDDPAI